MNVKQLLSKYLLDVTPTLHKIRRSSLFAAIESTINGGVLSVTGLGRNIDNSAYEKHRIKCVDRLCGNVHLQQETPSFIVGCVLLLLVEINSLLFMLIGQTWILVSNIFSFVHRLPPKGVH